MTCRHGGSRLWGIIPDRLGLFRGGLITTYCISKINRKHNNSKTERERGQTGSQGHPQGEELPCRFLSCLVTLSWPGHVPAAPDILLIEWINLSSAC